MNIIERAAQSLGNVVLAYRRARYGEEVRPQYISQTAEAGKWQGGDMGARETAQRRAIQNSWVYVGIDRKAAEVAGATLEVVIRHPESGECMPIHQHALLRILRKPNPWMSGSFLMNFTQWWMELDGNAFWCLLPDETGKLAEIWPLPSHRVRVVPGNAERFVDYYEYQANGQIFHIPAEYVCHFKYPNPFDVFRGLSPLVSAMLPTDADSAMARWNGAFFGQNNVMPSAAINLSSGDPSRPIEPADLDALKNELNTEYAAVARKTAITNAYNMTVSLLGWNAKDMDFLQGRQFTKEEILQILGMPPGLLDKNATEANATVALAIFKDYVWGHCLTMYAETITSQILIPWYHPALAARYQDTRIRNSAEQMVEVTNSKPYLTVDEVRQRYYGMPALPDGRGARTATEIETAGNGFGNGLSGLGSGLGVPNAQPVSVETVGERTGTASVGSELKLWRQKALKRVKNGERAAVEFQSNFLPSGLMEAISEGLECAENGEDVKTVFAQAEKGILRSWRPWSAFEERLASVTLEALRTQASALEQQARERGQAGLDDPQVWAELSTQMRAALEPTLLELANYAAGRVQASLGASAVNVNWNLANEQAAQWAREQAGQLVTQVTNTTKQAVGEQVGQWAQSSEGMDGLIRRIQSLTDENGKPVFNEARAQLIATTEATNTYAGANAAAWQGAGYAPAAFKPGAHVGCRCYIQPWKMADKSKVLVWYTARDERVCTKNIQTPWGAVAGCKELHRKVISEGPHLGKSAD